MDYSVSPGVPMNSSMVAEVAELMPSFTKTAFTVLKMILQSLLKVTS